MSDTIKPEVGKTYLTRNGLKARCICTDMRDDKYPVVCLVDDGDMEAIEAYTMDGHSHVEGFRADYDLVAEAPRVVTVDMWVELTPDGGVFRTSKTRINPISLTGTVVKLSQDVELPA
jgi:hypothetical protein